MSKGFLLILMALLVCCSKNTSKLFNKEALRNVGLTYDLVKKDDFTIPYTIDEHPDAVFITYLGSGGYFIKHGNSAILIDPFFSPYGIYRLGMFNIHTKTENVKKGMKSIAPDVYDYVHAMLITHAHYDHLLDAPYVFNHFMKHEDPKVKIYGNSSVKTRMDQLLDSSQSFDVTPMVCRPEKPGKWLYLNDRSIRVMPVRTRHAPHLKILFPVSLYEGEAKPIHRYKSDTSSTHVVRWKGGCTFGYLIDILDQDEILFRIYLLTSASSPPDGFVAPSVLEEHRVNLAILGAASALNVDDYPTGIIKHLNPEKIILAHWEDLFKPYLVKNPRLIRATNFKKLMPAINAVYPWKVDGIQRMFMPEPGVKMILAF